MAKSKKVEETQAVELTVESLMSMGYSQADAEAVVGANTGTGGGLPFPLIKINYDLEIPQLAKKGEWVGDIEKDDEKETVALTNFGERIKMVILNSGFQYSRYNATTNSADISSNIFPMSGTKTAYDLKSGKRIADLKKNDPDNKIKYQEIILALISSDSQPEPKPYILYSKGAFMYTFGQCRKPLTNRGNMMYTIDIGLKQEKNGNTKYFVADDKSFVAKPRTLEEIKDGATTIPPLVKAFNDWVDGVNQGSSVKEEKKETEYADANNDDDDIEF